MTEDWAPPNWEPRKALRQVPLPIAYHCSKNGNYGGLLGRGVGGVLVTMGSHSQTPREVCIQISMWIIIP